MTSNQIAANKIAFDIDGVVADAMSLFIYIAKQKFQINIKYEDIVDYDLSKCLDIEFKIIWNIIEFLLSGDYDNLLNPINGACEVLNKIGQNTDAVIFVTARPDEKTIKKWLLNNLELDEKKIKVFATGNFEQKAGILIDNKISFFVEDRLETCYLLEKHDILPVVFKQPWNNKAHSFMTVNSWKEIDNLIIY